MALPYSSLTLALVVAASIIMGGCSVSSTSFDIKNGCNFTISAGMSASSGSAEAVDIARLKLGPGEARTVQVPSGTSGSVWGHIDSASGASGQDDAAGAVPPVTLVQFSTAGSGGTDVYAISLVDGYNLPISVQPKGAAASAPGGGRCSAVACALEPRTDCAPELLVSSPSAAGSTEALSCNSACTAYKEPRFCCTGDYLSPSKCLPSPYSVQLKRVCPNAITYPLDANADTVFACRATGEDDDGTGYSVEFCPASTTTSGGTPGTNGSTSTSTAAASDGQGGAASAPELSKINLIVAVVGLVTAVVTLAGAIFGAFKCCCT